MKCRHNWLTSLNDLDDTGDNFDPKSHNNTVWIHDYGRVHPEPEDVGLCNDGWENSLPPRDMNGAIFRVEEPGDILEAFWEPSWNESPDFVCRIREGTPIPEDLRLWQVSEKTYVLRAAISKRLQSLQRLLNKFQDSHGEIYSLDDFTDTYDGVSALTLTEHEEYILRKYRDTFGWDDDTEEDDDFIYDEFLGDEFRHDEQDRISGF